MIALGTALLFFAISREISIRYSSEIFKRIQLMSIMSMGLSILGVILTLFKFKGAAAFEWGAFNILWFASLHLWGLPWAKWMKYAIPIICAFASITAFVSPILSGAIHILILLGGLAYSFIKNQKSLKVIPVEAAAIFFLVLIIDFIYPSSIWRGWEGIVLFYALVARLIAYLHNIYHRSITDRLTGLYNRKTFIEYVESFLKADHKVGVIFLDIDDFKHKNDTEGHAAGDQVLIQTGALLQEVIRGRGVAGRLGGEEMVLLVVEDDPYTIAELVRERLPIVAGVTASIGVAYSQDTSTAQELIEKADDAMYEAKKNGKNRVVLYTYSE